MAGGVILPNGVPGLEQVAARPDDKVMVVNETDLPDSYVTEAVQDHFVESASMAWGHRTTFQSYASQGSLLARSKYTTPSNVIDEIILARDLAERDDDIGAAIGLCISAAFEQGWENFHKDEKTLGLYNAVAEDMNLDGVLKEFYREYLISGQLNTLSLFTRKTLDYEPSGEADPQQQSLAVPMAAPLAAENIRVLGNDMFGTGVLAYIPDSEKLRKWLEAYFDPKTSAGEKAALGRADRVSANMFIAEYEAQWDDDDIECLPLDSYAGNKLYILNPGLVQRTTMPKGSWKYPRPPITRNFALLEAKRLLNIMDYALLQGGSNFVIIAKKGSDQRPAMQEEVDRLQEVVRTASKTGVIVGDHRLSFDILTPDLTELLNPVKRKLIGRKLTRALLRLPENDEANSNQQTAMNEADMMAKVITSDRGDIQRHVVANIYGQTRRRNRDVLKSKGPAKLWFPKIILQGGQVFTDYVLKLRDRGDIPRKWAVQFAGMDFEAGVEQRKRELEAGVDETMAPAAVPFSSPDAGPQDNNPGRPPGAKDGAPTNDPHRPRRQVHQNPGETVRASYEPSLERVVRAGVITAAILEEYPEYALGRIKAEERATIAEGKAVRKGPLAMVPVNLDYETVNEKAINLTAGLRIVIGERRGDRALVSKLISFREPEFSTNDAESRVARWGFPVTPVEEGAE